MKYYFELSKEHLTLPIAEIKSILKGEAINYKIVESLPDILIILTDAKKEKIQSFSNRLSMTYYINQFLFSSSPEISEIKKFVERNPIKKNGSIAIRYKNRSNHIDSQPILRTLAKLYTKNKEVELENPDIEGRCLITNSKVYFGIKLAEINRKQFNHRKAQKRPFFSPISLHPKLARVIVNLSSIKKGETLLDPFCGTGGILLEAGLIGAKIIGSDIEEKMIGGCKKNLDFYNIKNYNLFCADINDIINKIDKVDAVVTDLPYGKSTTTKGEKIYQLYKRSFENISKILNNNKIAVIGIPNKDFITLAKNFFNLKEDHQLRVHKSLTRHFVVFKN
jgi:tRNA (guanine10-N2)-dimethyltransferase